MSWVLKATRSSIGGKYLMALSGIAMLGFLVGHISGNLLIFFGRDAINAYGVALRELPFGLLWILRIGTLAAFLLHFFVAFRLTGKNRQARPQKYVCNATIQASAASRSMIYSGLLVFVFLAYHLAHFTFRITANTGEKVDEFGRPDIYAMVVEGFQQPTIAISYVLAMVVLGLHLSHGLSSMFQTFGINHPKYNPLLRKAGPVLGWGLAVLYISIPVSVWLNLLGA